MWRGGPVVLSHIFVINWQLYPHIIDCLGIELDPSFHRELNPCALIVILVRCWLKSDPSWVSSWRTSAAVCLSQTAMCSQLPTASPGRFMLRRQLESSVKCCYLRFYICIITLFLGSWRPFWWSWASTTYPALLSTCQQKKKRWVKTTSYYQMGFLFSPLSFTVRKWLFIFVIEAFVKYKISI